MSERDAIVVTGIGVYSSIGCGRKDFWESLVAGRSGVARIGAFDPALHKSQIASEVRGFEPERLLTVKQARRMARVSQLAACAALDAVRDAGLDLEKEDPFRVGCVVGSAAGDYATMEEQHARFLQRGPGSVNPLVIPKVIPNMPAANVAIVLGIQGPNMGVSTACATGAHAIGIALGFLRQGLADVVLAGGAESTITPYVVDGYSSMGVLSKRNEEPERASRPFDVGRDGFVIGEGAGVLVLETLERAKRRGAMPLACIRGFGMTCDAHNIAIPEATGKAPAEAMKAALRDAGLDPGAVRHINAHGTSTKINDRVEANAIGLVFGDDAKRILVTSTKSMVGHTLGAAGALEAAATVLALHHGVIAPTINYETRDPECDLNVVGNEAMEVRVEAALSNSFGFGGQNGVLAFSKIP
jgi:3-oxoacyl-[acyl-carrier-protein] synthase II